MKNKDNINEKLNTVVEEGEFKDEDTPIWEEFRNEMIITNNNLDKYSKLEGKDRKIAVEELKKLLVDINFKNAFVLLAKNKSLNTAIYELLYELGVDEINKQLANNPSVFFDVLENTNINSNNNEIEHTVEINGDPKVGTIVNIGQFHKRPEFNNEQMAQVGEYQYKILLELLKNKPKHVFLESLYEDFSLDHPERSGDAANFIKSVFGNGKMDVVPNNLQREIIAEDGAAFVYAYLNDDVFIHKVLTKEESDLIDKSISNSEEGWADKMFKEREKFASREVKTFLSENPGEKVYIIFGSAHSFEDDFKSERPPVLERVQFKMPDFKIDISNKKLSNLNDISGNEIGPITSYIADSKDNSQLQLLAILKAVKISDWGFQHIKNEKGQLLALDKLEFDKDLYSKNNDGILKDYLLKLAVSDIVRLKIQSIID